MDSLAALDRSLLLAINRGFPNPLVDFLAVHLCDFGMLALPLAAVALYLLWALEPRGKIAVLLAGAAVAIADIVGANLKFAVGRERPWSALPDDIRVVAEIGGNAFGSFPSNHAINTFAAGMVLFLYARSRGWRWAWVCLAVPALVAIARVRLAAHYPTDVLAGALLGATVGALLWGLDRWKPFLSAGVPFPASVRPVPLLVLGVGVFSLYRVSFVLQGGFSLASEECQYWDWSRHLDWAYYSKPPAIAYIIRGGTLLFGDTPLGVRAGALVASVLLSIVAFYLARLVTEDDRPTALAVALLNVAPLFALGAIVHMTDVPMMVGWGVALLAIARATIAGEARWWWVYGVALGFGLLSKYAMIYAVPCLFLYLGLVPSLRHWLRRPEPYLATLLGLLCFAPVVYWNAIHGWIGFLHVGGQAGLSSGAKLDLGSPFEFLASQFGIFSPVAFVGLAWGAWWCWRTGELRENPRVALLLCFSIPVIAAVALRGFAGKVQANWAAPAYFTGAIFAAWMGWRWLQGATTHAAWRAAVVAIVLGIGLPGGATYLLHEKDTLRKATKKVLEWKDLHLDDRTKPRERDDPFKLLSGWRVFGEELTRVLEGMPNKDRTFIFSKSYQLAAQAAFNVEGQPRTMSVRYDRRMNQYDLWRGWDDKQGWDAIYVTYGRGKNLDPRIRDSFVRAERVEPFYSREGSRRIDQFVAWRLYDFKGTFPDIDVPAEKF